MKLVFMGTPVYALSCLEALIGAGHEIAAVFTQPDKPKNRGKQIQMTPVKELALKHEIPVYQPLSLRKGEDAEKSLEVLKEIAPECIVVVAYGQLLPESILELPKYGCINVHASLLPMYRGAAPIQRCIQFGEKKSGVTTMYMAKGLDTGDMILRDEVEIPETMTGSELHDKLAEMGGKLIVRTLEELQAGTAPRIPQEGENLLRQHDKQGGAEARLHQARSPGSGLYPCDVRGALRLHYARRKAAEGLQRGACGEERCGAARGSHRPGYLHGSLRRRRG